MVNRSSAELLDELVRLQSIQLRRQLASQSEAIVELSRAGFGPSRIAELLGTSAATVQVTIQRSKRSSSSKKRSARD